MYTLKPMWDVRSGSLESMFDFHRVRLWGKITNGPTIKACDTWASWVLIEFIGDR